MDVGEPALEFSQSISCGAQIGKPLPDEIGGRGASKSAARRRFVQMTAEWLEEWRHRDISDLTTRAQCDE